MKNKIQGFRFEVQGLNTDVGAKKFFAPTKYRHPRIFFKEQKMLKNYFITALNNLIKNKLYSVINIAGLANRYFQHVLLLRFMLKISIPMTNNGRIQKGYTGLISLQHCPVNHAQSFQHHPFLQCRCFQNILKTKLKKAPVSLLEK